VTFSISVSNPVNAHYQIDFDDAGQTGAGAVPSDGTFTVTHSYAAGPYAGAINPVLTVTGPGGQDTKPTSINVQ